MKRDIEYMKCLLLEIEGGQTFFEPIAFDEAEQILHFTPDKRLTREEATRLEFHLDQLAEEGLVSIQKNAAASWFVTLTSAGHRYLEKLDPGQLR